MKQQKKMQEEALREQKRCEKEDDEAKKRHKRQEEETLKEQKRREKEEAEMRKQHKITFPISVSTAEMKTLATTQVKRMNQIN